jgi:hypothetical protein
MRMPYLFECFFDKRVKCAEFNPKIWKKKKQLPEPCKRCDKYKRVNRIDNYVGEP